MATEAKFLLNASTSTESQQTQTPPDLNIGATINLFAFIATRVATVRTLMYFFRLARTAHSYSEA